GPDFALGAIDPIGANMLNGYDTKYGLTSYYAVATQRLGPLAITAGWGVGDRRLDNYARRQAFLDGPFGGLALGLPLGFELLAEWDALRPNGAIAWNGPFGISLLAGRIGSGWTAGASTALSL
ncbi:MAG: hypothetical protein FJZ00_04965, partial [Candidatus Sericytochromatia bacterium]|nr:hypothetical protein [Candidatus Tanganyikabacteria bacterium]